MAARPILSQRRQLTTDGRTRATNLWIPIPKTKPNANDPSPEAEEVHSLLLKAGYLRNAYPGIFHMLPLGLRVQEKIEKLVDKNMKAIGTAKNRTEGLNGH
ncbi:hypothetical protein ABW19_dt0203966 [Dactylella cylindrospora]|nr:hypothetical protein ABW19_dt0203966 [Dactylella cylindrospora]